MNKVTQAGIYVVVSLIAAVLPTTIPGSYLHQESTNTRHNPLGEMNNLLSIKKDSPHLRSRVRLISEGNCPPFCTVCTEPTICTKCEKGYFIDSNNSCSSCMNHCVECQNKETCTRCDTNFNFKDQRCVYDNNSLYLAIGGFLIIILVFILYQIITIVIKNRRRDSAYRRAANKGEIPDRETVRTGRGRTTFGGVLAMNAHGDISEAQPASSRFSTPTSARATTVYNVQTTDSINEENRHEGDHIRTNTSAFQ